MEIVAVEIKKAVWCEKMLRGAVEVASGVRRMCVTHCLRGYPQLVYQYTSSIGYYSSRFKLSQCTPSTGHHQSTKAQSNGRVGHDSAKSCSTLPLIAVSSDIMRLDAMISNYNIDLTGTIKP